MQLLHLLNKSFTTKNMGLWVKSFNPSWIEFNWSHIFTTKQQGHNCHCSSNLCFFLLDQMKMICCFKHVSLLSGRLCCSKQQRKTLIHPDLHWRKVSRWLWIFHADTHTWSAAGSRWRKHTTGAAHSRAVGMGELGRRAGGGRLVSETIWGSVWLIGAPRVTALHCQCRTQIERKRMRWRMEGSRVGRGRDRLNRERGMGSREMRGGIGRQRDRTRDRQTDRRREGLSVCTYQHMDQWTFFFFCKPPES